MKMGANYIDKQKVQFRIWAPNVKNLKLVSGDKIYPMKFPETKSFFKYLYDNFIANFIGFAIGMAATKLPNSLAGMAQISTSMPPWPVLSNTRPGFAGVVLASA